MIYVRVFKLVISLLAATLFLACSPSSVDNSSKRDSAESNKDSESVDFPVNVSGAFLSCEYIDQTPNSQSETFGCNVLYDGQQVNPSEIASDWNWNIETAFEYSDDVQVEIIDLRDEEDSLHQVHFSFSSNGEIVNHDILNSVVNFNYTSLESGEPLTIRERLRDVLAQLENKQYLRLSIESVMVQQEGTYKRIDLIELLVDGKWYTVWGRGILSIPPTVTIGQGADLIGRAVIPLDPSLQADATLLANSISDWGNEDNQSLVGTRFSEIAPHDADAPFLLDFRFNQPVSIEGIRFDGGNLNSAINATGAPDKLHLEVSDDGQVWDYVSGSDLSAKDVVTTVNMIWGASPSSPESE